MRTLTRMFLGTLVMAAAGVSGTAIADTAAMNEADMHAAHHHMMHMLPAVTRTTVEYVAPPVKLVRDDGKTVFLPDELNDGRPVVLNFIFTTCTEICPLVSHTLEQLQAKLGADRDRVHLVSISIDPEQDTPSRLAAYARKYDAGPEWQHYSGTLQASIAAQRAFDAYRGDKMDHVPVTFLHAGPGTPWIRLDGFATADQLLGELRSMLAAR